MTLVEMLVTLAILLLMMTVIVQIFQAATGALNAAQVYQELDNQLRLLDLTIRSDLAGVTCKLTPPNNPKNNTGYLEYGENEFADLQGEDSDDYIRFTAKAPAGRPFTGRMWIPPPNAGTLNAATATALFDAGYQPITVTSDYAEIIYFLRNGNLYRRVLLIAPDRQSAIVPTINNTANISILGSPPPLQLPFKPSGLNPAQVSWQSMNDLSAHPAPRGAPTTNSVILNTLGDLTSRENRSFYQRFADDFWNIGTAAAGQDGLSDDLNGDNVPDYYPALYPGMLPAALGGSGPPANLAGQLIYEPVAANRAAFGLMAFPFVFPGAYSRPQVLNNKDAGWIHSPEPIVADSSGNPHQYDGLSPQPLLYLQNLNHNPIDGGDNLPDPSSGLGGLQTWWGFPTWRETLSPFWTDPTWQVNTNLSQPFGLAYQPANVAVGNTLQFLPDMTGNFRNTAQPYNDGLPNNAAPNPVPNGFFPLGSPLWNLGWEDDLVMTGVRSFDIKAYDNAMAGYADLGWGDDLRLYQPYVGLPGSQIPGTPPGLFGTPSFTIWPPIVAPGTPPGQYFNTLAQTFAHEGRMPPLQNDNRLDASYPNPNYTNWTVGNFVPQYSLFPNYSSNVGDDNPAVFRLRRVWDSWSTEYTQAPGTGVNPASSPAASFPAGPPYAPPIYPSYPPPYPAPLRGIQIQIRVTDPANQRVKTLTIRQDFTDKL